MAGSLARPAGLADPLAEPLAGLVVGVDTHRDTHAAAICAASGAVLAGRTVAASAAGYGELLDWARQVAGGQRLCWALEGTRHYGLGLARHLAAAGEQVAEIGRVTRLGKRRAGKTDPVDAVRAARELLASGHHAEPRGDGDREVLRLVMCERDHLVDCAKTARAVLAAVIVTAPDELREDLRQLSRRRRPRACADLACPPGADQVTTATCAMVNRLGARICDLDTAAAQLEAEIAALTEAMAPGLVAAEPGLGVISAAQILLSWSHPGRIRSEAAFAMISGTAPLPASSGATTRHRLNRLGDRQLNRALHTIAVSRMRYHPPTIEYTTRRRAEGKTTPEIRRCIKRYLARHLYRTLNHPTPPLDTA